MADKGTRCTTFLIVGSCILVFSVVLFQHFAFSYWGPEYGWPTIEVHVIPPGQEPPEPTRGWFYILCLVMPFYVYFAVPMLMLLVTIVSKRPKPRAFYVGWIVLMALVLIGFAQFLGFLMDYE